MFDLLIKGCTVPVHMCPSRSCLICWLKVAHYLHICALAEDVWFVDFKVAHYLYVCALAEAVWFVGCVQVTTVNLENQHMTKMSNLERLENLRWASFNNNDLTKIEVWSKCLPLYIGVINYIFKGQVQGLGWFLTRFPLKFAENSDVGEIVICTKTGIFCHTESVPMMLKIMCTYAHYVTLGSRCKMANRLGKNSSLYLQGWSSDAIVSSWAFVYFLLVISSFSNLVRCVACQSFLFCLL